MILTTQAKGSSIEYEMAEQKECQPFAKKTNHVGGYYDTTIVVCLKEGCGYYFRVLDENIQIK
jgi:hypothetical protein